jgi:hypothetical protein
MTQEVQYGCIGMVLPDAARLIARCPLGADGIIPHPGLTCTCLTQQRQHCRRLLLLNLEDLFICIPLQAGLDFEGLFFKG